MSFVRLANALPNQTSWERKQRLVFEGTALPKERVFPDSEESGVWKLRHGPDIDRSRMRHGMTVIGGEAGLWYEGTGMAMCHTLS